MLRHSLSVFAQEGEGHAERSCSAHFAFRAWVLNTRVHASDGSPSAFGCGAKMGQTVRHSMPINASLM
jgi:hypothetical protein